jgi:hypothetical protein
VRGANHPTKPIKVKEEEGARGGRNQTHPLDPVRHDLANDFETALGPYWRNDAGKWIIRIQRQFSKALRVLADLNLALRENRIRTTPARYAEYTWQDFSP